MSKAFDLPQHERKERLLWAVICLGCAGALIWHHLIRVTKPPLYGAIPWTALFVGLVLFWRAVPRPIRILEAIACLVGATIAVWFGILAMSPVPWLAFLLGLVMLWRAIPLRAVHAAFVGPALALLGIVPLFPFWLITGGFWLALIGVALPFCVGVGAATRQSNPHRMWPEVVPEGRTRHAEGRRRSGHPASIVIWFLAMFAAEYFVVKFHYDEWRPISARGKWVLDYAGMIGIVVVYIVMMRRLFRDPFYRGGRAVFGVTGGLLCAFNLALAVGKLDEARQEVTHDVDFSRPEVARYRGGSADIVVYSDSFHSNVLVDEVVDVMVEHHRFQWQSRVDRLSESVSEATFEREGDLMKVILLTAGGVPRVVSVDWK
jgi:ABC-type amino acid transport system permease subunit